MNDLREDRNNRMNPIYLPEESQQQKEMCEIKEKIRIVNEKVNNDSRRTLRFLKKNEKVNESNKNTNLEEKKVTQTQEAFRFSNRVQERWLSS